MIYHWLSRLFPTSPAPVDPRRIVFILPCCIGDVVLATAALAALRRAYPHAEIVWAVGTWSKPAIERHDLLDAVVDTGPRALPVATPGGLLGFAWGLRVGRFDLAVSLVRSPLMSLALLLAGIPHRAGLNSDGRGFGYTVRARVDPQERRHEAQIYLEVVRALGHETEGCWANVPVYDEDAKSARQVRFDRGIPRPYLLVNPAGGRNPGMAMDVKRWPPALLAQLVNRLAARYEAAVVLVAGPGDEPLVDAVQAGLDRPAAAYVGSLSFGQIGALARDALLYIGNDTGLTHYAAAAGADTVMIFGPSDPARYAPFTPNSLALWKPTALASEGVAVGAPADWDWTRDGIGVDEAESQIVAFLAARRAGGVSGGRFVVD